MQVNIITMQLFDLGRVMATPGALDALAQAKVMPMDLIARHANGDWGDLGDEDKAANQHALESDNRIFSSYILQDGVKIWVITEWDRSYTTILLPSEY